jgi:methionyl-tRNA synthetase
MKPFYVTTPIYYVNDRPHIGTAYSTIAADVLTRYQRLRGRPGRFLTGLDEHGLKIARAAEAKGMSPQTFVDQMQAPFRDTWKLLDCEYDDFIRTSEPRHKQLVAALWERITERGDIYLGEYEDWYCVGCEMFYTEKDLLPGNICPVHQTPVERIKESSYFFRLSKYTQPLLDFYDAHPDFVKPAGRLNEVKSFVREGLRDLSLSRTSFTWGIPVPSDPKHVMYVWFDALTNYMSALGGPAQPGAAPLYDQFWPPSGHAMHIVGKDILRQHAIYWPAFLLSAGIEPPTQVWAHGWLTVNGQKMSKSLGNFLAPEPLVDAFGVDALRYYLMRDIAFGQDGDFSHENLLARTGSAIC